MSDLTDPQSPPQSTPQSPPQQPQQPQQPQSPPPPYPLAGPAAGFQPSTAWAVPAQLPQQAVPRGPRPWLRTALRWSVAAGVFLFVAAVTAICVSAPARTDLPGLKTPSDHRYTFPALELPPLPPGAVGPNEQGAGSGGDQTHAVDLRKLLLPEPVGAKPDHTYPGATGWYSPTAYAAMFDDKSGLLAEFSDSGLRHIAATAWTGPDGSRTEIYLLQFRSADTAADDFSYDTSDSSLLAAPDANSESGFSFPGIGGTDDLAEIGPKNADEHATDIAYLACGEVEAVVLMTNPESVNPATFRQVVVLQNEMLQG